MKITEDHIREDYMGNVYNGETIHGLKRWLKIVRTASHTTFCGGFYRWAADKPVDRMSDEYRKLTAEKITCKRCRSILGLENKSSDEPDYYLILDTSNPNKIYPIVACKTQSGLKFDIHNLIDQNDSKYVEDNCRIVGVKEVSNIKIDIIPKGYDIILTKQ
jgi:hypothetical protein